MYIIEDAPSSCIVLFIEKTFFPISMAYLFCFVEVPENFIKNPPSTSFCGLYQISVYFSGHTLVRVT